MLLAAKNDEKLIVPDGEVCVKFCLLNPIVSRLSSSVKFNGSEVESRCPFGGSRHVEVVSSRHSNSSQEDLNTLLRLALHGLEGGGNPNDINGLINSMTPHDDDKSAQRVCRPLESRLEPIALVRSQIGQRSLYYRFEVLPAGSKRCCCY